MGDDVEGIVVGDKRTEVQTCHVLNRIFPGDALCQFFVGTHLVAQVLNLLQEFRMTLAEGLTTLLRTCIEHSTVCQDDFGRDHHTVTVGMHTAVHTRGIVDDNTTYHRTSYRGRVRREHTTIGLQDLIYPRSHDSRLQFDVK